MNTEEKMLIKEDGFSERIPSGYTLQLYQYARRYNYNGLQCIDYFNNLIKQHYKNHEEDQTLSLEKHYLTFGEFDILQVTPISSFREYHDLPQMSRDWLGKRQMVLLYDLNDNSCPTGMYFDAVVGDWICQNQENHSSEKSGKLFCIVSMLALTNEVWSGTTEIGDLLRKIRKKILELVEKLNGSRSAEDKLICEVYGTFNTSELAVVWLSNQYVDVLNVVDYIKHMWIPALDPSNTEHHQPVFLNSFSVIAVKNTNKESYSGVKGTALIQLTAHENVTDHASLTELANQIADAGKGIAYSVGEYDLVVRVSAKHAIPLFGMGCLLGIGKWKSEDDTPKQYERENRSFLSSNTRLLYNENDVEELERTLKELWSGKDFEVSGVELKREFQNSLELEELQDFEETQADNSKSNAAYYKEVRRKLKEKVHSSAGIVDALDMLYTDYHSAVANAYSAMWVSDLHCQFKSILFAIDLLLDPKSTISWNWNQYKGLINNFQQQIYHLSQSSRLFFEVPSCHHRATGQFDFLMHSYYGIVKKILEVIYLTQGKSDQSELVPLITVNTVPQVKSQIAFEVTEAGSRVINLDIPNSVIFDPHRGLYFLTHELFHYAAPYNRKERNEYLDDLFVYYAFLGQFFSVLKKLLLTTVEGTEIDNVYLKKIVTRIFGDRKEQLWEESDIWEIYGEKLLACIERRHKEILDGIEGLLEAEKNSGLRNYGKNLKSHQRNTIEAYAYTEYSNQIFEDIFIELFPDICECFETSREKYFCDEKSINLYHLFSEEDIGGDDSTDGNKVNQVREKAKSYFDIVKDRLVYCKWNKEYLKGFVRTVRMEYTRGNYSALKNRNRTLWDMLSEAGADVAMVSMNGMSLVDYLLFQIQVWRDIIGDTQQHLHDVLKNDLAAKIRVALVSEYCAGFKENPWIFHRDYGEEFLTEEDKNKFIRKYIWINIPTHQKKKGEKEELRKIINTLNEEAKSWIIFFKDCKNDYLELYPLSRTF